MVTHRRRTQFKLVNTQTPEDYMRRAIGLARKGAGFVQTNPMVGSVLVGKDGVILAESFHAKFGGAHAERRVLEMAIKRYPKRVLQQATLYVTLEPCSHKRKKTPPCFEMIITSGVKHVVIGSVDPNPMVNGRSTRKLRALGIKVDVGVLKTETDYLIRAFKKWITTGQPYVLAKVGMSIDGKITSGTQVPYITNAQSLERVHQLRQEMDVIMVGVNTIIHDNPRLDTRLPLKKIHHPIKVILDSRLRTPANSRALDDHTIIACLPTAPIERKRALARTGVELLEIPPFPHKNKQLFDQLDMTALLELLGQRGYSSILLEGGSYVFTTFINLKAVDEFYLFTAPYVFGATQLPFTYALKYTVALQQPVVETLGTNTLVRGYAEYRKV